MLTLKDQELFRRLDALSDGDFTRALKSNRGHYDALRRTTSVPIHIRGVTVWVDIPDLEIESRKSYCDNLSGKFDSDKWNRFPQVEPLSDCPMRVEIWGEASCRWRGFGIFKDGKWEMDAVPQEGEIMRYRPWIEPWERE